MLVVLDRRELDLMDHAERIDFIIVDHDEGVAPAVGAAMKGLSIGHSAPPRKEARRRALACPIPAVSPGPQGLESASAFSGSSVTSLTR